MFFTLDFSSSRIILILQGTLTPPMKAMPLIIALMAFIDLNFMDYFFLLCKESKINRDYYTNNSKKYNQCYVLTHHITSNLFASFQPLPLPLRTITASLFPPLNKSNSLCYLFTSLIPCPDLSMATNTFIKCLLYTSFDKII